MRKPLVATFLLASSIALAACSMPADDPNYNPDAALAGQDAEVVASQAAADAAALDAALAPPTSIGVDVPLSSPPAEGAVIISIVGAGSFGEITTNAITEAADTLGWTHETVAVDIADFEAADAAFKEALDKKPAGIHISGEVYDSVVASLPDAETAGVPVVCTGCAVEPGGGMTDASIDGAEQNVAWADVLASYVIGNQYPDEDAAVQIITVPGGAVAAFNDQFDTRVVELCVQCQTNQSVLDPTITDVTDEAAVAQFAVDEMSFALGGWALLDSGALAGVGEALTTSPDLISPVAVVGRAPAAADIEALKALAGAEVGEQTADGRTPEQAAALQAWMGVPLPVVGWRVVDQFARIIGGDELATGPLPSQFLTAANVADAVLDEDGNFIGIADYQEQFKALWGVS